LNETAKRQIPPGSPQNPPHPPFPKGGQGGFVTNQMEGDLSHPYIPLKQAGALEERLLFTLAVRSAKKALILTAPHLNPSTGSPRTPSLYLFEAAETILGRRLSRLGDAPGLVRAVKVGDWIRKDWSDCGDALELLLTAMDQARKGDPSGALALAKEKPFYFEGCDLLKARNALRVFTAYDGILSKDSAAELEKGFSLKRFSLSASRLETFAACPLRYFYKYVLKLSVHPDPERVVLIQASDRGNLMHEILEKTLKRGLSEGWVAHREQAAGFKALEEETARIFRDFENQGVPGAPALWAWEKAQMAQDLRQVLDRVLEDQDWVPLELEVGFGAEKPGGAKEVLFPLPGGTTLRLQGRMDRVDVSRDGKRLRVVDYKSGGSNGVAKDSVKAGTKLQLPFYLWALQNLFPDKKVKEAL